MELVNNFRYVPQHERETDHYFRAFKSFPEVHASFSSLNPDYKIHQTTPVHLTELNHPPSFTKLKRKSYTTIFSEDYLTANFQYVHYPEQEFL